MVSNRILWLVRARARQSDSELRNSHTSKSTSRWLYLNRAGVRRHIAASDSEACFAAGIGFKVIHMSMLGPATSWRGAGGAAGPPPDVSYPPPGTTININPQYCYNLKPAAGFGIKAAG